MPQDQNFKDWFISEYELVDTEFRYDGMTNWRRPKSHFQGFKSARYVGRGKLLNNNKNTMSSFDEEILICI